MKKLTLGLASLALLTTLGCGSLRGDDRDDSDSDSDEDSDEDSDDEDGEDANNGGVLPIDGGDNGDGGSDGGGDEGDSPTPTPAPPGDDEDPAPAPSTCPGIPAGGRCSFEDDGFVMLETCDDGEVERTVCANDHFSAENRCVETAAGAECVSATSVKLKEEEPAYICLGSSRDYLLFLGDEDVAVAIDLDTDEEAVGEWTLNGTVDVNVAGFVNKEFSFFDENAVVVRLFELDQNEECFIVGYEGQDAIETVFDCRATGFAGSDDIVLTLDAFGGLEFFMVEDVAQGTGVEVLEETQRFGGYYVEGDRIFLGIDFQAGDFHRTDLAATTLRFLDNGTIDIEPIGSFIECEER